MKIATVKLNEAGSPMIVPLSGLDLGMELYTINRLTEEEVLKILEGCVRPIDAGLHWDFKKFYDGLFEAITGEKDGS